MPAYYDISFQEMWEESCKMDDPTVFSKPFTDAGLNGDAILERTQNPAVKAALVQNTAEAVDHGVFGIPTLFVGDEMFFGKERLGQVEAKILK